MATNATAEHVALVLQSLGEAFLEDIPAAFDKQGIYFIEYNTLANALINGKREWYQQIADHVNGAHADSTES
jgi:hypothetical protein